MSYNFYGITPSLEKDYIKYGTESTSLPQPDWSITDNGRLLLEGTAKIFFNHDGTANEMNALPVRGSTHPYDARLQCYHSEITFTKLGIGYCEAKYVGLKSGHMTDPEWSLSGSVTDVSIRFHPKFREYCIANGYDPKAPITTAVDKTKIELDGNGSFKSFGYDALYVPAVDKFSTPSGTCKVNFYCDSVNTWAMCQLGSWCNKPPYAPKFLDYTVINLNWLITGVSVSEYGHLYKVEVDCTLSQLGKRVNKYMYDECPSLGA